MSLPPLIVETRCAHWGWDEHQYFGHPVFEELLGKETFTSITALAVLRRKISVECRELLDDAAVAMCLVEPRIWPLKLTRLVASYGQIAPAVAAGLLIEESAQIGPWTCGKAATTLALLHHAIADRTDEEQVGRVVAKHLASNRFVWGFGTPFRPQDERLVAFRRSIEARGRDKLPFWISMEAIAAAVTAQCSAKPNIGLGIAAACLDMGFGAEEIGALATALMHHAFFANAGEGAKSSPDFLRRLPGAYIHFKGAPPRLSPRMLPQERTG